jgi:hypothetical protein
MPEAAAPNRRVIGLALLASAILLGLTAALSYTGVLPLADEVRGVVAIATGAAALLDVLVAVWFLRSAS